MVDEYKDRLEQAMKDAKVSTAELASSLKVSYQAVRKVLLGGQFGMDNNAKAAKRLGVRSDWLATGKGPKRLGDAVPAGSDWPFSQELLQKCLTLKDDGLYRLETVMRAHLGMNQQSTPNVTAAKHFDTTTGPTVGHHRTPEDGPGLPEDIALPGPKQHGRSTKDRGRAQPKSRRSA